MINCFSPGSDANANFRCDNTKIVFNPIAVQQFIMIFLAIKDSVTRNKVNCSNQLIMKSLINLHNATRQNHFVVVPELVTN